MAEKAFNKKLARRCEYCVYGKRLDGLTEVICKKRGITDFDDYCRAYKYDPLKRIPESTKAPEGYSAEDFEI